MLYFKIYIQIENSYFKL